jgi:GcrA cell cycle regulator
MPIVGSWTLERVEKLRVLWAQGLSAAQIAVELGEPVLSRNSIISKANRTPGFVRRLNPTAGSGPVRVKGRPVPMPKAKRVTLPPLPINGPVLTSDTKLLKSAAWLALPGTEPKSLTDLGAHECRWPIGENPTLFCGCATEKLYCAAHDAMAYRPLPEKVAK